MAQNVTTYLVNDLTGDTIEDGHGRTWHISAGKKPSPCLNTPREKPPRGRTDADDGGRWIDVAVDPRPDRVGCVFHGCHARIAGRGDGQAQPPEVSRAPEGDAQGRPPFRASGGPAGSRSSEP